MRNKGLQSAITAGVLAGFLPLATTGCFGKFELTQSLWRWNKQASDDKWVREIVFLALAIIPVYGGAVLVDVVVINSMEFWTGKNPLLTKTGAQKVVNGPDGERVTFTRLDTKTLDVVVERDGQASSYRLLRDASGVSAVDPEGKPVARVLTPGL